MNIDISTDSEVVVEVQVNGRNVEIRRKTESLELVGLIADSVLIECLRHVQHPCLRVDPLPRVARRMRVDGQVPVEDLLQRFLRTHFEHGFVAVQGVDNADLSGLLRQFTDDKRRIHPPRKLVRCVHCRVSSQRRHVNEASERLCVRFQPGLVIDTLLQVPRVRVEPMRDVGPCDANQRLSQRATVLGDEPREIKHLPTGRYPRVVFAAMLPHFIRSKEPFRRRV
mmetsp:Transcript_3499/g.10861  ORF Transcript_3499/g.10861 Transcript_3499/m.10861 type:complete len:225 (-) Transcript_3499:33-707(-)